MVETIVTIEDWENANSYDKQSDLIMVTCEMCWDNTEDESISNLKWERILLIYITYDTRRKILSFLS